MFRGMDAVSDWLHCIALFEESVGFRYPKKAGNKLEILVLVHCRG